MNGLKVTITLMRCHQTLSVSDILNEVLQRAQVTYAANVNAVCHRLN